VKKGLALLLVCGALLMAGLWWQSQQLQSVQRSRMIMGTLVEISATGHDGLELHRAIEAAFAEMERLEQQLSPQVATSEVARLGNVAELEVSTETREVVAAGLEVARRSRGAFDLTLGRLVKLWDVNGLRLHVPKAEAIHAALEGIGPQALELQGTKIVKRQVELQPELGGVAKGYAVEAAARKLRNAAVTSAAVNAGGDMALVGYPQQRDWRIGIRHPRHAEELLATLVLPGGAVVTSGDYERYFEVQGVRYHHLFDPRTGYPAQGCQSVTVWAGDATLADALATAAFVLGPEQGLTLLRDWREVEGLLVAADGSVQYTPGLEGRIEWP